MSIGSDIVAGIIQSIDEVFKTKKLYTLHQWQKGLRWVEICTFSARQCKKARNELIRQGEDKRLFSILRKGVKPREGGPLL